MDTITPLQRQLDKLDGDRSRVLKQKLEAIQRVLIKCVSATRKADWAFGLLFKADGT